MRCRFASCDLFQPGGQFQPVDLHVAETYRTGFFLTADPYIVIYSEGFGDLWSKFLFYASFSQ